ncbi:hypothetical protein LX32DRAFT_695148 [Colletotrichum zoysiae]|uniref:Uncharacterized protein n=1 Tax=Colletotrichum zoysiae TaxID=1216348 RepID=A0AAD9HEZ6_9PEZI|nr:hypothetical protein LX32DRAFT_695148 [Colletotrichum zoysiae]
MKSQLRSSQPTSPRRQHQSLESAASPPHRLDTLPFQRTTTMRRLCQDPLRCEKGPGLHSHLVQVPWPVAVGPGVMRQKRARPGPTETGTPSDKKPRAEPERQQAPKCPAEKRSPGAYDSQIEEAFRELLDKLVRWKISTPEDAQALRDELGKMGIPPVPAPPAEVEEKRLPGPEAAGDGIRPGARGLEEAYEKEQEAKKEAESLAFEVVDASDAEGPGDEFCCVFDKEVPADVDGEYVLL